MAFKSKEDAKSWRISNKEKLVSYEKARYNTPIRRASVRLNRYRQMDKLHGFGDVIDFDAKWIVENIFTKPCVHCGETDWHKIGCNRIDNNLPHIKSNVEPCCWECNKRLNNEERIKTVYQYDKNTLELVRVWKKLSDIGNELGYHIGDISSCCNGKLKQTHGYIWSYKPL